MNSKDSVLHPGIKPEKTRQTQMRFNAY